jgi:hypothetical protein
MHQSKELKQQVQANPRPSQNCQARSKQDEKQQQKDSKLNQDYLDLNDHFYEKVFFAG